MIDTNIYVDWLDAGRHAEVLFQPGAVKNLSAVVIMELRAGALSREDLRGSLGIVNDVLIALSARSIGATVVTQNERDYRAIERVAPFRLGIVR